MNALSRRHVAILFREDQGPQDVERYMVSKLVAVWRRAGLQVSLLFGARGRFVPADVLLVHVDLSVVPERYLALAEQYPIALNANVGDIRKSVTCGQMASPGDAYAGPVIVKSELNYGGLPERLNGGSLKRLTAQLADRLSPSRLRIRTPTDYKVFPNIGAVPAACFRDRRLVVQKFLPEMEDGLYHVRYYTVLGDRATCFRSASDHPIVKASNRLRVEQIKPHQEIIDIRRRFRLDYGKLDYTVHEGRVVLLDVNKTMGGIPNSEEPATQAVREAVWEERAKGMYSYLTGEFRPLGKSSEPIVYSQLM